MDNLRTESEMFEVTRTYKILVTHPEVPMAALQLLQRKAEVTMCESVPPNIDEILSKARGVHGLLWASSDELNAEVLDAIGPQLKSISTMSAGIENIDINEVQERQIALGHTTSVYAHTVADLGIGLMIAASRRFTEGRQKIERSSWENYHHQWMLGKDIRYSTVGFYGFGAIGQAIAKRLSGFDISRIIYTTRHRVDYDIEKKYNASKVPFDSLLSDSDFIFIAAPLTNETKGVFDSKAFAQMKNTAVLINVARGAIVNQDDLYVALESEQIFAAGLDVLASEPLPADDKLLTLPNCVIVPHLGSATYRTRNNMAVMAANNVLRGLDGKLMIAPAF